jgi:hypothetical protein
LADQLVRVIANGQLRPEPPGTYVSEVTSDQRFARLISRLITASWVAVPLGAGPHTHAAMEAKPS